MGRVKELKVQTMGIMSICSSLSPGARSFDNGRYIIIFGGCEREHKMST